jgi:hypothetical protein
MRCVHILAALAAAASFLGGSVASAQVAPGYSGTSDAPTTATQDQYWFFLRELGRCLAQSKRTQSVALVHSVIDSAEEKRAFDALIRRSGNNVCMQNMVRATVVRAAVRGVVAENLYKMQPVSALQAAAPEGLSNPASVRSIHDFADCYVAGNYADARSLLANTKLGTREETDRVRKMAPGFSACLPQGREIRIVATDIRLALSEALYRASAVRPNGQP